MFIISHDLFRIAVFATVITNDLGAGYCCFHASIFNAAKVDAFLLLTCDPTHGKS
jgi:hypothetical protein